MPTSLSSFSILDTDTAVENDGYTAQITGGYDAVRNTTMGTNNPQRRYRGGIDVTNFASGSQYISADSQ